MKFYKKLTIKMLIVMKLLKLNQKILDKDRIMTKTEFKQYKIAISEYYDGKAVSLEKVKEELGLR